MILSERAAYMKDAVCLGAVDVMYRYDLMAHGPNKATALAEARGLCARCPVRQPCGEQAMEEEDGAELSMRNGIRAGMTPAQRISIERRGGLKGRDPIQLIQGRDGNRQVPPVPDEGDQWSKHHTTLARKVVRWLADNVAIGASLPAQASICEKLGCTHSALARVMEALVQDGTLDYAESGPTKYMRRANPRVVGSWLPPHLRHITEPSGDEGVPCADATSNSPSADE